MLGILEVSLRFLEESPAKNATMPQITKNRRPAPAAVVKAVTKKISKYVEERGINDPRKEAFLNYYFNPASETFSNGYKSALSAGFSPYYAKVIIGKNAQSWIQDFRVELREKILNTAELKGLALLSSGSDKVAADMVKFFLGTLGKEHYSPKHIEEHQHTVKHQLDDDQVDRILRRMTAIQTTAS